MTEALDGKRDFFVSFNQSDRAWATWIAWVLEEAGYSVFFQDWDFRGNFVEHMNRAHAQAQRTLAVLSDHYFGSAFTLAEWSARFAQDPAACEDRLVPVKVGQLTGETILRPILYADLTGCDEAEAQKRLLARVQKAVDPTYRPKPTARPGFPGGLERKFPERPRFPDSSPNSKLVKITLVLLALIFAAASISYAMYITTEIPTFLEINTQGFRISLGGFSALFSGTFILLLRALRIISREMTTLLIVTLTPISFNIISSLQLNHGQVVTTQSEVNTGTFGNKNKEALVAIQTLEKVQDLEQFVRDSRLRIEALQAQIRAQAYSNSNTAKNVSAALDEVVAMLRGVVRKLAPDSDFVRSLSELEGYALAKAQQAAEAATVNSSAFAQRFEELARKCEALRAKFAAVHQRGLAALSEIEYQREVVNLRIQLGTYAEGEEATRALFGDATLLIIRIQASLQEAESVLKSLQPSRNE